MDRRQSKPRPRWWLVTLAIACCLVLLGSILNGDWVIAAVAAAGLVTVAVVAARN